MHSINPHARQLPDTYTFGCGAVIPRTHPPRPGLHTDTLHPHTCATRAAATCTQQRGDSGGLRGGEGGGGEGGGGEGDGGAQRDARLRRPATSAARGAMAWAAAAAARAAGSAAAGSEAVVMHLAVVVDPPRPAMRPGPPHGGGAGPCA